MHWLKSHSTASNHALKVPVVFGAVVFLGLASTVNGESMAYDSEDAADDHEQLRRGQLFRNADHDHDGKISLDEYRKLAQERADQRFKLIDKNGDNSIDRDEIRAAAEAAGMRRRNVRETQKPPNE